MPRQNNHAERTQSQLNWADVANTMEDLRCEHGGLFTIVMDREGLDGMSDGLMVKVRWYVTGRVEQHATESIVKLWPTLQAKTMPTLLYWTLLSLSHQIDRRTQALAQGQLF